MIPPGPLRGRTRPTLSTSFQHYLERRGYRLDWGAGAVLRRMFLDCWAQPGFHLFWRVWNPLYGYVLFRLYQHLGGTKRRYSLTLLIFSLCGFVAHDLPVSLFVGRPLLVCTAAFFAWGVLVSFARLLDRPLAFASWPRALHVVVNLALVGGGLLAGVVIHARLTS